MGFLENLIRRETRKLVSNVVDNVVNTVVDNVSDVINPGRETQTAQEEYEAMKTKASNTAGALSSIEDDEERCLKEDSLDGKKRIHVRLTEIVAEQWPAYELRQDVAASEFAAEPGTRKYSYVLYNNYGAAVLSVMVLNNSNHYRKKEVVLAHEASERKGVPCINLMTYMPCERSYIYNRLRGILG